MAFLQNNFFPILLFSIILLPFAFCQSLPIYDLLKSNGLPGGLLPKEVKSYTLSEEGVLEVILEKPCLTKFDTMAFYERVVKANLTYGGLIGVEGLSQEELFLWFPVKDIVVDDPKSGLILLDIGLARKQLSLSLFEDPPHCNAQLGREIEGVSSERWKEDKILGFLNSSKNMFGSIITDYR